MIDLHTHSTASDGSLEPRELVRRAQRLGLAAIALTDHDTITGNQPFMKAGLTAGVRTISGVEIACSWYGGSVHLVGLFVDPASTPLHELLAEVRANRTIRNRSLLERLASLGMAIDPEELTFREGAETLGRPHIAEVLVSRGHCASTAEAFARFLGPGRPAYVPRFLPLPPVAINTVHQAGGVAVWAHPCGGVETSSRARLRQTARQLVRHGLDGLEAYYSDYTPAQSALALEVATEYGLLPSGGSDFHGTAMPDVALGTGHGDLAVPDSLLEPLLERAASHRLMHSRR